MERRRRWVVFSVGLVLLVGCGAPPTVSTASPRAATPRPTSATALPTPRAAVATSTALQAAGNTAPLAPAAATPAVPVPAAGRDGEGSGGLFLEVVEPATEMLEVAGNTQRVAVVGRTRSGAVVSVDGELVALDRSGAFRTEVSLEDEVTVVEVVASDTSGAEVRAQRVIVRND